MRSLRWMLLLAAVLLPDQASAAVPVVRSARSGPWSAPTTWESGKVPTRGARVLIRTGHRVVYDVRSDQPIRAINVAGIPAIPGESCTG